MHCDVALTATVAGLQVIETEVIVGAAGWTVTDAVPAFVGSCVLVAVTVAVPAEACAVNSPLELTVPLLADQVTAEHRPVDARAHDPGDPVGPGHGPEPLHCTATLRSARPLKECRPAKLRRWWMIPGRTG